MNVSHLQLGISDAALMASSDGAYGEVELRPSRKFEIQQNSNRYLRPNIAKGVVRFDGVGFQSLRMQRTANCTAQI
jgi:hypothetical protein